MIKKILIVVVLFLTFCTSVNAAIFQSVIITSKDRIYCFYRRQVDNEWQNWQEWPVHVYDRSIPPKSFKPKRVSQDGVEDIFGKELSDWLDSQRSVSGYYNFSNNKRYDWKEFVGYNYGTYTHKRLRFKVYPQ